MQKPHDHQPSNHLPTIYHSWSPYFASNILQTNKMTDKTEMTKKKCRQQKMTEKWQLINTIQPFPGYGCEFLWWSEARFPHCVMASSTVASSQTTKGSFPGGGSSPLKNHGLRKSVGMMKFLLWWESHKSHVPVTTNQIMGWSRVKL